MDAFMGKSKPLVWKTRSLTTTKMAHAKPQSRKGLPAISERIPGQQAFWCWVAPLFLFLGLFSGFPGIQHAEGSVGAKNISPSQGWFVNMKNFSASAHGSLSCRQCHGDMDQNNIMHPDSNEPAFLKMDANRRYDYKRCESCHKPTFDQYSKGSHAKALLNQKTETAEQYNALPRKKKAPTCGDCHSAHYDKAHLSRVALGRQMISVCGTCHPAQTATYLENYHGKAAVNLGNKRAAFCTDCHGAHNCLSLKDQKKALETCQRCHPKATESFTQIVIHPTTRDVPEDDKAKRAHVALIRVITIIMSIIAILVVAFFYGHSFVWILRELHEKLRKHQ